MSKITNCTVRLMMVTMISKVLGFIREIILGYVYGASIYSDIYITSFNIPNIIFSVIGIAITTTFIPLYYENNNSGGEKQSSKFVNNIFNICILIGIVISVFIFIFAEPIVKLFAVGFEGETLAIAIKFTRIMIFGGIFIGLSNIMQAILQINENFIITGLTGVPFNIIIIISIILGSTVDIILLPVGTMIAISSQFLFQLPFAYKKGYKYEPILNLKDKNVKKMLFLVAPVLIGVAVNQVNAVVDKTLASTLVEGSISSLNYANRLNGFVMGMFITSIATVIYPMLSRLSTDDSKEKFIYSVSRSINSVILLIIPISVGAIVLATPIVKLLFQRGAFDSRATSMTSIALVFYSIGMVGFGLRDILGKVFYALQDTKTPMVNGAISMGMNIILNLFFIKLMGHAGLAFATSLSALICILLLFNSLKKKIGYFGQDKIFKTTVKALLAAVIMGIITNLSYKFLISIIGIGIIAQVTSLFLVILIGAIVYGILLVMLKIEEMKLIVDMITKKLNIQNKICFR